jgi:hypothetical protein
MNTLLAIVVVAMTQSKYSVRCRQGEGSSTDRNILIRFDSLCDADRLSKW